MRLTTRVRAGVAALAVALAAAATPGPAAAELPPQPRPTLRFLVSFDPGAPEITRDRLAGAAGRVLREVDAIGLRTVEVDARQAASVRDRLLASPSVRAVELDLPVRADLVPDDPSYASQWAPPKVKLPAAWDVTTGDDDVVIAIVDTGVTPTIPDLPTSKLVPGRNIISSSPNAFDDNGHGTASASVAAMVGNNGSRAAGACWQCRIMPVKVLSSSGSGSSSNVAAGIVWAVDNGADVINLSLSGGGTTALRNAVALAESRGIPVVASAGNDSRWWPAYPAGYSTSISVAATDANDRATSYTNYGSWVKLAAPGTSLALNRTGAVVSFSGTSASAPLVAGTVGLMLSAVPSLTPAQIRSALMGSADPAAVTLASGSGRLDAEGALAAVGATPTSSSTSTSTSSSTSSSTTATTAPPGDRTVSGRVWAASGTVSRALTIGAGPVTFGASCSWCSSQRLDVLDGNGLVVATTSGGTSVTLQATLPAGSYTFRVVTNRYAIVTYQITYRG